MVPIQYDSMIVHVAVLDSTKARRPHEGRREAAPVGVVDVAPYANDRVVCDSDKNGDTQHEKR